MKVGIITFHRAWNYGAVLQCYALQQAIKNLGHDVKVIDYRQSAIEKCYQTFSFKGSIKALLKPEKCYEQGFLYRNRIRKNFKAFRRDFLQLTSPCKKSSIPLDFNAYVIVVISYGFRTGQVTNLTMYILENLKEMHMQRYRICN